MSDQGEKTCPLCAEEMDLTDQQLKPCKCGYEICIWCWHHIMDMAEKDETEGRCPACRNPYNKEKIVGMAPNCEKIVAEMNMEKKLKSSYKGKSKTSESRKQLCSVRVIQRNLVYIVGLPLNLADEDLLQHKEYFAQYGKVLKVSISRTAAGAIQHFPNNTCSVYITYSKEEEAVRCIQSVHGFVLEGRPLKACFGTTKYCHAWLRNVPCTNPDCLYLHEIGSQEDSFTKDEIISAYTRSRVQQISGATNSMQRRSGSILPPPADNYCNNSIASTAKPISKSTTSNSTTSVRVSPPNSSSGRSAALPAGASWGTRASNNQPPPASLPYSNETLKSKPEISNSAAMFSAAVASTSQCLSLHADRDKQLAHVDESGNNQDRHKSETPEPAKQYVEADDQDYVPETPPTPVLPLGSSTNGQIHIYPAAKEKDCHIAVHTNTASSFDSALMSNGPSTAKASAEVPDYEIQQLCSEMSSLSNDRHQNVDQSSNPLTFEGKAATCAADESCMTNDKSDCRLDLQMQVVTRGNGDGSHSSDDLKNGSCDAIPDRGHTPSESFNSSTQSPFLANSIGSVKANMHIIDRNSDPLLQPSSLQGISNGYQENIVNCYADVGSTDRGSSSLSNADQRKYGNNFEGETATADCNSVVDMGESSIISNILSLDFDPWDAPLTSPQNLAKLLGDSDKQPNLRLSNSLKLHTSNQSRFSFAREEKPINQAPGFEPSFSHTQQAFNHHLSHDFSNSRSFQLDNPGPCNGFSLISNEDYSSLPGNYSTFSSNKLSVSRSQMSAPPGFSVPNRAPPPGFASHERVEQNFSSLSGNQLLDTAMLRNQYQNPPAGNMADNDGFELMDPAILAVGKEKIPSGLNFSGMDLAQSFPPQLSTFDNEARLQLLMQRSLSPHQNQRLADTGDNFSPFHDAYGIPSRAGEQTLASNHSPFSQFSLPQSRNPVMSNGHHWDVWNGVNSGNDLSVAELFRTERVGLNNNFYSGYDESKFRTAANSGSFYNRTFGI
nr:uncharacterized protein LOC109163295 isoform X2 [Ipomoea batatas]